ncbi:hypothetical protein [Butyrivibrio sp. WCE2006]|uniref:hypothetical protein n=1 Tax=Butyrivibrio sp. WCE2006 TaxID=1410611 RepID=UPI0018CC0523
MMPRRQPRSTRKQKFPERYAAASDNPSFTIRFIAITGLKLQLRSAPTTIPAKSEV